MNPKDRPTETALPAHEHVYRTLRADVMHGVVLPGQALTIRGLAERFGVSMTPAREAMRRLTAEGALTLSKTGRITTPMLSVERIEELASIRALLEPELAARAQVRVHMALIERLQNINAVIEQMILRNDSVGYIRSNLEFHRTLYLRAQAPAMLAIVETVWLQMGPTMSRLYSSRQRPNAARNHRIAVAALMAGDETALKQAIATDVTQGLRMLIPNKV
ncbi:MAG: GntR family transcriptional regulator [Rhodobacteraceae bacterium]|nr:GntR family transcriptional regulator [Paracoccaceae bacterium]